MTKSISVPSLTLYRSRNVRTHRMEERELSLQKESLPTRGEALHLHFLAVRGSFLSCHILKVFFDSGNATEAEVFCQDFQYVRRNESRQRRPDMDILDSKV